MKKVLMGVEIYKLVELFRQVYETQVKEKGNFNGKHYKLSKGLIDKFGITVVLEKARRLYLCCKEGKEFFAKQGFVDFTLENLSVHWNRLVGVKAKAEKLNEELEKRRLADERIKQILDRGR